MEQVKEKRAAYMREWRAKNNARAREISRAGNAKYRLLRPESNKRSHMVWNDKAREAIVAFFGGKCAHCGFSDPRALQMDHIHGGGTQERKDGQLTLAGRYRLITKEPEVARFRFQLLCANCNWIKRAENKEYGNGRPRKAVI